MTPEPFSTNDTFQSVASDDERSIPHSPKPAQEGPQVTFPDGGLVAWLNVCGSFIVCFCSIGFIQVFGIYQDYYTRISLNEHSPSEISWIGSLQVFLQYMLSGFAGKLFDDGYFKFLLLGASTLLVFSTFMLSLTQPHHYYQVLLSQGFAQGIATGLMPLPSITLLTHYFLARRAMVIGIAISGASVAGIALPILLNHLFNSHIGFAWGVRILGFIALGLLTFANIVMKPRFVRRRPTSKQTFQLLKKMATDVPFLYFNLGLFLICLGLYFPVFYLQLFAVLHGIDENLAFYSVPILNGGSFVGRIIPNFIADYYGSLNCLVPISFLCGALIFLMFAAKTVPGLVIFALLYGFASGAFLSLGLSSTTNFADDISEIGNRNGAMMLFISVTLLVGTPITGALVRPPLYEWHRPIIFCAVFMLAGSILVLISRNLIAKRRDPHIVPNAPTLRKRELLLLFAIMNYVIYSFHCIDYGSWVGFIWTQFHWKMKMPKMAG